MITIIIIEDNEQFRQSLATIIESEADFELAGSYSHAEPALAAIRQMPPDIVIADISLPGITGVEMISQLQQPPLPTQFMICSIHDDNDHIFEALRAGASGYVLKDQVTASGIVKDIRDLYLGGSPMSPYIARRVIQTFTQPYQTNNNSTILSSREKEVLELLAKGLQYKEIAHALGITHETVKKHLKNIYGKLHVQNKIEALNKIGLL